MCGIAGFFNREQNYTEHNEKWNSCLCRMRDSLRRRGPDQNGTSIFPSAALAHARLSIIDAADGLQPMSRSVGGKTYAITYNGEIYNTDELRKLLTSRGHKFRTRSDTEVILCGIIEYGIDFVNRLNGIFAFAFYDSAEKRIYLVRDRLGVKPLFYTVSDDGTLVFASEIKALFKYPGIVPQLDSDGLNQIFSIGPARTPGNGVFKGIHEVLPGYFILCSEDGLNSFEYWRLKTAPHTDNYQTTVEKTVFLVHDAIKRQIVSDVPVCSFLSGGVDSSIVSAVCAAELAQNGGQLDTFSFDFSGNDVYYKSNAFQPSRDRPWVDMMVKHIGSNHTYLECDSRTLADYLYTDVDARDLPGMADVDSSLVYFCSEVAKTHKVALTGECADEIFGGYPWFRSAEAFAKDTFPWTHDTSPRKALLNEQTLSCLNMDEYISQTYKKSLAEVDRADFEDPEQARRREISYLNMRWFMQTLLDRMDRAAMYSGLEARVPFADHRIVEYLWNVPWDMKYRDGVVKSLLREAGRGTVPEEVLFRPKSPYPKTYNPEYDAILKERLASVITNPYAPINQFIDKDKCAAFMQSTFDYGKPWYGQLMAAPQLLAYMLQVNYWLEKYNPSLCL